MSSRISKRYNGSAWQSSLESTNLSTWHTLVIVRVESRACCSANTAGCSTVATSTTLGPAKCQTSHRHNFIATTLRSSGAYQVEAQDWPTTSLLRPKRRVAKIGIECMTLAACNKNLMPPGRNFMHNLTDEDRSTLYIASDVRSALKVYPSLPCLKRHSQSSAQTQTLN